MFNIYKYRQHIIWFCLTIFVILTPTMAGAVIIAILNELWKR